MRVQMMGEVFRSTLTEGIAGRDAVVDAIRTLRVVATFVNRIR
jgi:hypothetical protein